MKAETIAPGRVAFLPLSVRITHMLPVELQQKYIRELEMAEQARQQGLEGRARVCARRAAGVLLQGYYPALTGQPTQTNVYDLLNRLAGDIAAPPAARQIANHFVQRVNEDYTLPAGLDLIAEAKNLKQILGF